MQIGNRVEVARALLATKAAVQVTANPDVPRGASELTDVVDVINDGLQPDYFRLRLASYPAGVHHPGVKRHADHRIAFDEGSY